MTNGVPLLIKRKMAWGGRSWGAVGVGANGQGILGLGKMLLGAGCGYGKDLGWGGVVSVTWGIGALRLGEWLGCEG
ncbi:unnamed protein product [Prunus brigantina]